MLRKIIGIIEIIIIRVEQCSFKNYLNLKGKISKTLINNPFEVVYVPVMKINYKVNCPQKRKKRFFTAHVRIAGIILDGNWDLEKYKFTNLKKFIALKQRFIEKKKWEDTIYYTRFEKKGGSRGIKNWKSFLENHLIARYDKIYQSIKNDGYKRQENIKNNLSGEKKIDKVIAGKSENEIEVCIGRRGEIFHHSGVHRLSIAKILGIKEIPVIVNVWHKDYIDWVQKNTDVKKITPKKAIQPILEKTKNQ